MAMQSIKLLQSIQKYIENVDTSMEYKYIPEVKDAIKPDTAPEWTKDFNESIIKPLLASPLVPRKHDDISLTYNSLYS